MSEGSEKEMKSLLIKNGNRKSRCIELRNNKYRAIRLFLYQTNFGNNISGYEIKYNTWESMIIQEKEWVNKGGEKI